MNMNDRAEKYLQAFHDGEEFPGGLAFRKALLQVKLDYTVESLSRIDRLLDQIRTKLRPEYGEFIDEPQNQNFLFLLCFYVGKVAACNSNQVITWYDYEGMIRKIPDNGAMFPQCFETAITCILNKRGFFVPLSSICSRLFDESVDKSVRFSAEGFM